MGRHPEFKAAKSFTLGLSELMWLSKHCKRKKIKASVFINNLLRIAMVEDKEEQIKETGPSVYCTNCNDWPIHTLDMICTGCNKLNLQLKQRIENMKDYKQD